MLDRAEVTGKAKVELEVKPREELLAGIVANVEDVPAGTPMREFTRPHDGPVLAVASQRVENYTVVRHKAAERIAHASDVAVMKLLR